MSDQSKTTKHVSIRMPLKELSVVDTYAAAHGVSRAAAVLHFIRLGIAADAGEAPATKSDLAAFAATVTRAIEQQPIAVQQAQLPPAGTSAPDDAWKDKPLLDRLFKR